MYEFISEVGFVNYLNRLILLLRILNRAKRIGVKDLSRLVSRISPMIAKSIFWTLFILIGSTSLAVALSFLGENVDRYSAVVVAAEIVLFFVLRFICKNPLINWLKKALQR